MGGGDTNRLNITSTEINKRRKTQGKNPLQ